MTVKHIGFAVLAVGLAAIVPASTAFAAGFDPHRCSAIQNVDLPYDVSAAGDRIAFTGKGRHIVVTPAYVDIDGQRFSDATLSPAYYQNIRGFLHTAGAFPKTAAQFGKSAFLPDQSEAKQNFLSGITAMCHSILNLAADESRMRGAFPAFVSPVEITLSKSQNL